MILIAGNLLSFFIIAAGFGCSSSFVYVSHLYYGVTGSKKRSGRMLIHEFILCGGMFIGAFVSGYLSDHFGRYMPYKFGLAVLILSFLVQVIIWFSLKPQKGILPQEQLREM